MMLKKCKRWKQKVSYLGWLNAKTWLSRFK